MATKKAKKAGKIDKKVAKVRPFRGMRAAERVERMIDRLREKHPMEDKAMAREWLKFTHSMRGILDTMEMDVRELVGMVSTKAVLTNKDEEED